MRQKLGNFYRYHCHKMLANKARAVAANPLDPLNVFRAGVGPPRRQQALQVYSNIHYREVIKPALEAEQKRLKGLEMEEPFLRVLRRVTTQCWEEEEEDLHKEIEDTVDAIYKEAKAEYDENTAMLGQDSVSM